MTFLAKQQLSMLRRMAPLEPLPCFIGGYAEDALFAGSVTSEHGDQRLDRSLL